MPNQQEKGKMQSVTSEVSDRSARKNQPSPSASLVGSTISARSATGKQDKPEERNPSPASTVVIGTRRSRSLDVERGSIDSSAVPLPRLRSAAARLRARSTDPLPPEESLSGTSRGRTTARLGGRATPSASQVASTSRSGSKTRPAVIRKKDFDWHMARRLQAYVEDLRESAGKRNYPWVKNFIQDMKVPDEDWRHVSRKHVLKWMIEHPQTFTADVIVMIVESGMSNSEDKSEENPPAEDPAEPAEDPEDDDQNENQDQNVDNEGPNMANEGSVVPNEGPNDATAGPSQATGSPNGTTQGSNVSTVGSNVENEGQDVTTEQSGPVCERRRSSRVTGLVVRYPFSAESLPLMTSRSPERRAVSYSPEASPKASEKGNPARKHPRSASMSPTNDGSSPIKKKKDDREKSKK